MRLCPTVLLLKRFHSGTGTGWTARPETGCQYRLSDDKASWYFAVRKCHEEIDGAQLASVKNQAEADFVSTISHGADKWIYGFHEDTAWNVDFTAANLWMEGEPGNAAAELRYCAYQHSTAPRVAAGICSQKKHYVCKVCSSPEAVAARRPVADTAHKIDVVIREKRSQAHEKKSLIRAKRSVSSTTTTTEVPRGSDDEVAEKQVGGYQSSEPRGLARTSTTTTTAEPRDEDSGEGSNVVNVKAETGNAEASSSESNSSLSGGAIAGIVIGGLLLVLAGIVVGYAGAKKNAGNAKAKAEIAAQLQFDDSVV